MNKPQFVVDDAGNRIGVILDLATYTDLIEAAEDREDEAWARDYATRKAAGQLTPDEQAALPLDEAVAEIERARTNQAA